MPVDQSVLYYIISIAHYVTGAETAQREGEDQDLQHVKTRAARRGVTTPQRGGTGSVRDEKETGVVPLLL